MGRPCSTHERDKMRTKFWSENLNGRELGRRMRRRKDNIRIDLREIVWGSVDWIQLAQDRDKW
jgi:hypothetical protein